MLKRSTALSWTRDAIALLPINNDTLWSATPPPLVWNIVERVVLLLVRQRMDKCCDFVRFLVGVNIVIDGYVFEQRRVIDGEMIGLLFHAPHLRVFQVMSDDRVVL